MCSLHVSRANICHGRDDKSAARREDLLSAATAITEELEESAVHREMELEVQNVELKGQLLFLDTLMSVMNTVFSLLSCEKPTETDMVTLATALEALQPALRTAALTESGEGRIPKGIWWEVLADTVLPVQKRLLASFGVGIACFSTSAAEALNKSLKFWLRHRSALGDPMPKQLWALMRTRLLRSLVFFDQRSDKLKRSVCSSCQRTGHYCHNTNCINAAQWVAARDARHRERSAATATAGEGETAGAGVVSEAATDGSDKAKFAAAVALKRAHTAEVTSNKLACTAAAVDKRRQAQPQ